MAAVGKKTVPPAGNTGALTPNTPFVLLKTSSKSSITSSIDWLAFSFPDAINLQAAKEIVGLPLDGWIEMSHGGLGYSKLCRQGNVSIYSEGQPGMGVHVEMSGKGCREMEAEGVVTDWQEWLKYIRLFGAKVSRLDVAWDDRSGWLNWQQLETAWREGDYTSRSRCSRIVESRHRGDPSRDGGRCLYIGSPQSMVLVRIYDKAKEQGLHGHWLRVELQARSQRADVLAKMIERKGIAIAVGVLHNYLDFKEADASRLERSRTVYWWAAFLNDATKVRLAMARVTRTLDAVRGWLARQVAPSLALITLAEGGSVDWINSIIHHGAGRLTSRQLSLVPVGAR